MEFNQSSMQSRETQFNSFKPTSLVLKSTQFEPIVHFQPGVLTKHLWEKAVLMIDESHQGGWENFPRLPDFESGCTNLFLKIAMGSALYQSPLLDKMQLMADLLSINIFSLVFFMTKLFVKLRNISSDCNTFGNAKKFILCIACVLYIMRTP